MPSKTPQEQVQRLRIRALESLARHFIEAGPGAEVIAAFQNLCLDAEGESVRDELQALKQRVRALEDQQVRVTSQDETSGVLNMG